MDLKANLERQAAISKEISALHAEISRLWDKRNADEIEFWELDSGTATSRELIAELGDELSGLSDELVKLLGEVLPVIEEALGDAYAYRTDSGEDDEDDLEDHERETCERYRDLAKLLGVTIH